MTRTRVVLGILVTMLASGCATSAPPPPTTSVDATPPLAASPPPALIRTPAATAAAPAVTPEPTHSPEATSSPKPAPAWIKTAPMPRDRDGFDAVLLGDGTVLVVGNDRGPWVIDNESGRVQGAASGSELADLYDPVADAWTAVESLNKPRRLGALVALPDGSAMALGGINSDGEPFSSTKIFSPATRHWEAGPQMTVARLDPTAVTLGDGRILVVGATTAPGAATSEVYDPATGTWSGQTWLPGLNSGVLAPVRLGTSGALALTTSDEPNVTDGFPLVTYVFEAFANRWTPVGPAGDGPTFWGASFVTLANGDVLAVGGGNCGDLCGGIASHREVWRFDQQRRRWADAALLAAPRENLTVALLPDGRVLATGGIRMRESDAGEGTPTKSTMFYDSAKDRWATGPDLLEASGGEWAVVGDGGAQAVVLSDGDAFLLGGSLTRPERLTLSR